ncbi:uridine kinase [Flavobacteriaceae bacterium]|nr:uridine kinase [Flavobacteriaceae bacterium]MDB4050612.1 uridine kinase [Flavobacteriaceae bacterium]MDB4086755.1 uridine kinase [Flavobacteriaceae bacterium]MDB9902524.1 uridine kinase [Flavobacteriaceae bacterium]MDC0958462.1 uridine kinase [Flavobacteriaceae bacterium]
MRFKQNKVIIIGICGGTCSGKSTISKKLKEHYKNLGVNKINTDSYYKDHFNLSFQERSKINFDHPDSIDFELLVNDLNSLVNNKSIKEPVYSYKTHKRLKKTQLLKSKKIIILEGLHIFCNSELINLIDFGLFLDLDSDSRLSRRIKRDIKERGRTEVEVINRFNEMCEPMYQKFIYPSRTNANVIINSAQKSINDIINLLNEFI